MPLYRALNIDEITLPPGTYYLEYEMEDIFMRTYTTDRIEIRWDGENMMFPDGDAWTGTFEVVWE